MSFRLNYNKVNFTVTITAINKTVSGIHSALILILELSFMLIYNITFAVEVQYLVYFHKTSLAFGRVSAGIWLVFGGIRSYFTFEGVCVFACYWRDYSNW